MLASLAEREQARIFLLQNYGFSGFDLCPIVNFLCPKVNFCIHETYAKVEFTCTKINFTGHYADGMGIFCTFERCTLEDRLHLGNKNKYSTFSS